MPKFIHSPRRDADFSRDADRERSSRPEPRMRNEEEEEDRRHDPDRDQGNGKAHVHKQAPAKFSGAQAVKCARQYIAELTGQIPESMSGLTRTDHGWKVTLDVVELERVPRTTDVLASYEIELDNEGELIGYHRTSRYYRNQVDER